MADAGQQQRERRLWLALGASACFQALTMSLVVVLLMGGVRSPLPAADGTEPADLQGRRGGRQLLGAAVQPWRVENGFVVFDAPVNFTSDVTANSKVDLNGMTYVQWLRVDDLARLYKVIIEGSVSIKRSLEVNETAFVRGDLQTENLGSRRRRRDRQPVQGPG
ncbi:hypothetical protein C2E20_9286 [Micractinium conductrix]|uniref:Uncharacterized protein n=1 Tax=Micractinium conductrix TaxID=554055 RepID=A0A2P6UYZ3_9CHLO|nr:hypothetical protein C2E20_9286 [Micractinium conductrix]|eukprot:PSC67046.1 hypothetical protein C2E20_9286 [Micractinium conductrix]